MKRMVDHVVTQNTNKQKNNLGWKDCIGVKALVLHEITLVQSPVLHMVTQTYKGVIPEHTEP